MLSDIHRLTHEIDEQKISFVIPCYKSSKTLKDVVEGIFADEKLKSKYKIEIVLVNDGSPDNTISVIRDLASVHSEIIGVDMTRNFGQHSALMAGFHFCTGGIVVCMDDDGQTLPSEVMKLVDKLEEGYDVVYARYGKGKKHSFFRNLGSEFNAFMMEKMVDKPKELDVSSFFAAKHFIIDEVLRYKNPYPYMMGLVVRSTRNICNVDVEHKPRQVGKSGYSLGKLLALWVNGFTSFSVKPLRLTIYMGMITATLGFCFLLYAVIIKLSHNPNTPLGWVSLVSVVSIIGGVILIVLGMIGEYVGRIYISLNNAPQYVIRDVIYQDDKSVC